MRKKSIIAGIVALAVLVAIFWPLARYVQRAKQAALEAQAAREAEARAVEAKKAEDEARAREEAARAADAKKAADEAQAREEEARKIAEEAKRRADAEKAAAEAEARRLEELRQRSLDAFARGNAAKKSGDNAGAVAAYREALAIDAAMAGAWTNLGLALDAAGNSAEALEAARKATTLPAMKDGKRRAHAMYAVGHIAAKGGARDEAVAAFEDALRADAQQASAALALASIWNAENKPEKALAALMVAHEAGARSAAVETAIALHWWKSGEVAKAQAAALDAMRCDRGAIDAKVILGWCHLSQKHWGDAAQQLDEAARARPDDANVHAALGYAYDKLGRHQEAVAEYDRAIAVAPEKPDTHAYRGAALEAVGEVEKARAAYETAAKGGGSQPVIAAQLKLAVAAYKEKRWADARKLAEGVVAADPKNAQGRYVLGLAAFALGDRKTAGEQEFELTLIDQARAAELRKLISKE